LPPKNFPWKSYPNPKEKLNMYFNKIN